MLRRIGRTIIAALIGLSVSALPAAAGFAGGAPATAATEISAPDCGHHNGPRDHTHKTAGHHACMAVCALNCLNFTAAGVSDIVFTPSASAALKPVRTSSDVASRIGSPPFRPPRT